jgi:hypothetical protein
MEKTRGQSHRLLTNVLLLNVAGGSLSVEMLGKVTTVEVDAIQVERVRPGGISL